MAGSSRDVCLLRHSASKAAGSSMTVNPGESPSMYSCAMIRICLLKFHPRGLCRRGLLALCPEPRPASVHKGWMDEHCIGKYIEDRVSFPMAGEDVGKFALVHYRHPETSQLSDKEQRKFKQEQTNHPLPPQAFQPVSLPVYYPLPVETPTHCSPVEEKKLFF
ncbi:uncharacterized protein LOC136012228 isoform X2 [Lathamus discolor]